MKYLRYFGYGSNMNPTVMKNRIGGWRSVKRAVLRDYKFVFMPKPGIVIPVIVPSAGDKVLGALYELTEDQMKEIDKYESPYATRDVEVETDDGTVEALAYVFDLDKFLERVQNYRSRWIEGMKHHGYSAEDIRRAEGIMDESIKQLQDLA